MTRMTIFPCAMWENPPHVHALLKPRLFGKMLFQERGPPAESTLASVSKRKMLTPLLELRTG